MMVARDSVSWKKVLWEAEAHRFCSVIDMMTVMDVCSRHDGTLVLWLRFVHSVSKIPKAVSGCGVHG
jgi:hypothetical protein